MSARIITISSLSGKISPAYTNLLDRLLDLIRNNKSVGDIGFSDVETKYTSLYVNDGTPYLAFQDGRNGNKATVMTFDGTLWKSVGDAGFSMGSVKDTSLYVDNGILYVAYQDCANGDKSTVMTFNGTSWESVGNIIKHNNL